MASLVVYFHRNTWYTLSEINTMPIKNGIDREYGGNFESIIWNKVSLNFK